MPSRTMGGTLTSSTALFRKGLLQIFVGVFPLALGIGGFNNIKVHEIPFAIYGIVSII